MKKAFITNVLIAFILLSTALSTFASEKLAINVKNYEPGSPVLLGIPFQKMPFIHQTM